MKNIINWAKKHPIITGLIIFFLIILITPSQNNYKKIKEKIEVTTNFLKPSPTPSLVPTFTYTPPKKTIQVSPTNRISQKKEDNFLSHNELLNLKEKVIGKKYKMILYLEQMPMNTDADFMTLKDPNDSKNILIRCFMNKYDLEKLDGESAQIGIYKSYKLNVSFKKFNSGLNVYEADCNLLE